MVYYNNTWGTICDDYGWEKEDCHVVCRQLGYSGGVPKDGKSFELNGYPVVMDGVECDGSENNIGKCILATDNIDCSHSEDVGCKCEPPMHGICDMSRHRIKLLDPSVPGIGRVEVRDLVTGQWQGICDDYWNDVNARVFCSCLGQFSQPEHYRAFWSPLMKDMTPVASLVYDSILCTPQDASIKSNIWDCTSTPSTGNCNRITEAAGVSCVPVPQRQLLPPPNTGLQCHGHEMTLCYTSSAYELKQEYVKLSPSCSYSTTSTIQDGTCVTIDMEKCSALNMQTDNSYKHYCYDVSYSQYDSNPNTLIMDTIWTRHICCAIEKNGSVSTGFQLIMPAQHSQALQSKTTVNCTITCFTNEFEGTELTFPAVVTRGQDLFCKVTADTWDSQLQLIVNQCQFKASTVMGGPSYAFWNKKCPTTKKLDLNTYSIDYLNWGIQFEVPKFQDYDELYLQCSGYVCDMNLDAKPYCDRTCEESSSSRRKRSLESPQFGQQSVDSVQFIVKDNGFGPLLKDGELYVVSTKASSNTMLSETIEVDSTVESGDDDNDDEELIQSRKKLTANARQQSDNKNSKTMSGKTVVIHKVVHVQSNSAANIASFSVLNFILSVYLVLYICTVSELYVIPFVMEY